MTNPPNKDVEAVAIVRIGYWEDLQRKLVGFQEIAPTLDKLPLGEHLLFTAAQLKEVELRAYERAIKECEEYAEAFHQSAQGNPDGRYDHMQDAAEMCADAIRKLVGEV